MSCCTPYRRCMIQNMGKAVQHYKERIVTQTALLYIRCTDMYRSLTYTALRVPQTAYTNYEFPWRPLKQVYNSESLYGSIPCQGFTLMLNSLLYTSCTDLYSSLMYIALRVPQAVYSKCTILKTSMAIHHTEGIIITLTTYLYTRCTDL